MRRANVLGATLAAIGTIAIAVPAEAQEVGADLGLFSSYVWRGLSLTNKPVAEPDLYVSFPAGKASVTIGGWANIDLGKYDDQANDISESGGLSAFNFAEFDPYAEIGFAVGKATLTGGVTAYIYPNNSLDNFSKKARAPFKCAAVASLPRVSAEKLMAQISMAVLNVHEIETQLASHVSGAMEVLDDRFDFTITEQRIVGGQFQALIQHRMTVKNPWFGPGKFVRAAVPARMRQLQTND